MVARKIELARMTWKEVQERVTEKSVVLLPVGAVEQHGLQTPVGADNFVAEYFARRVAEATDSIVAPTIPYGCSQFFGRFPGTIVVKPATLHAVVKDVVVSLLGHGFDHIVIVDNHNGNAPVIEHVAWEIRGEHGVVLSRLFPYQIGKDVGRDLFEDKGKSWGHGSEPVLSMMMALTPDDIRMDLSQEDDWLSLQGLSADGVCSVPVKGSSATIYFDQRDVSDTGVKGDPFVGSGERGQEYLERMVEVGIEFVNMFRRVETRIRPGGGFRG